MNYGSDRRVLTPRRVTLQMFDLYLRCKNNDHAFQTEQKSMATPPASVKKYTANVETDAGGGGGRGNTTVADEQGVASPSALRR